MRVCWKTVTFRLNVRFRLTQVGTRSHEKTYDVYIGLLSLQPRECKLSYVAIRDLTVQKGWREGTQGIWSVV